VHTHGRLTPELERNPAGQDGKSCEADGCEGQVIARGLCWRHYQQQRRAKMAESGNARRRG